MASNGAGDYADGRESKDDGESLTPRKSASFPGAYRSPSKIYTVQASYSFLKSLGPALEEASCSTDVPPFIPRLDLAFVDDVSSVSSCSIISMCQTEPVRRPLLATFTLRRARSYSELMSARNDLVGMGVTYRRMEDMTDRPPPIVLDDLEPSAQAMASTSDGMEAPGSASQIRELRAATKRSQSARSLPTVSMKYPVKSVSQPAAHEETRASGVSGTSGTSGISGISGTAAGLSRHVLGSAGGQGDKEAAALPMTLGAEPHSSDSQEKTARARGSSCFIRHLLDLAEDEDSSDSESERTVLRGQISPVRFESEESESFLRNMMTVTSPTFEDIHFLPLEQSPVYQSYKKLMTVQDDKAETAADEGETDEGIEIQVAPQPDCLPADGTKEEGNGAIASASSSLLNIVKGADHRSDLTSSSGSSVSLEDEDPATAAKAAPTADSESTESKPEVNPELESETGADADEESSICGPEIDDKDDDFDFYF